MSSVASDITDETSPTLNELALRPEEREHLATVSALITDSVCAAAWGQMRTMPYSRWEYHELPDVKRRQVQETVHATLTAALAGRTVVEPAREEYIGCHHPAWPDPLDFLSRRSAEEWFEENRERFPLIEVKRRVVSEWETVLDASGSVGSETPAPTDDYWTPEPVKSEAVAEWASQQPELRKLTHKDGDSR